MTSGELMSVIEVARRLHGDAFTSNDLRRIRRMVESEQIEATRLGRRIFIPRWQVEQLINRPSAEVIPINADQDT